MKRFHIIKKASPVNYALESSRTLDNGVADRVRQLRKAAGELRRPALRGGGGVYRGLSDPEVQRCGRR